MCLWGVPFSAKDVLTDFTLGTEGVKTKNLGFSLSLTKRGSDRC